MLQIVKEIHFTLANMGFALSWVLAWYYLLLTLYSNGMTSYIFKLLPKTKQLVNKEKL